MKKQEKKADKKQQKRITSIGGSALIEGIMMRGPKRTTVACRVNEETIYTEDISIKTTPQTDYTVGEAFTVQDGVIALIYDDGTTKVVTSGFVCSPVVLNKAGNQWITVIYAGQSTAFPVKVTKPVSSVTIKKLPTKRTYKVGESFNSSGMVVKVTYTDNTTEEITGGFTCTPSGKLNTKGQQKIVVSYQGKATGFYVTVA